MRKTKLIQLLDTLNEEEMKQFVERLDIIKSAVGVGKVYKNDTEHIDIIDRYRRSSP